MAILSMNTCSAAVEVRVYRDDVTAFSRICILAQSSFISRRHIRDTRTDRRTELTLSIDDDDDDIDTGLDR